MGFRWADIAFVGPGYTSLLLELDGVLMREGDEEIFAVSHGLEAQINSPNKTPGPLMFSQPFFLFFTVAIKN